MRGSCILVPKVTKPDGTEVSSKLYKALLENKNLKDQRALVNYIYALYLQDGGAAMDAAGYSARDENGEHLWQDVYKFYEITDVLTEQMDEKSIKNAKILVGATDASGKIIYHDNGKDALDKIMAFNSRSQSLVARLIKDGDKYVIAVEPKNAKSQWQVGKAEEQSKLIQVVTEAFNAIGYNFESLAMQFPEMFNIVDINSTINYLKAFQKTKIGYATQREIEFMLTLLPDTNTKLQRILTKWGTIEEAAKRIHDDFRGASALTLAEKTLISSALEEAKKFNNIDLRALQNQLQQESSDYKESSVSYSISKILKMFRTKYNIDDRSIFEVNKEIRSLSQAAGNAAIILNRRLKEIEKKEGVTEESKKIQNIINTLLKEIDDNRYFQGMVVFMAEVQKHLQEIEQALQNVEGTEGTQEYTQNLASILVEAKKIINSYSDILQKLSIADSLELEESITKDNLQQIMQIASTVQQRVLYLQESIKTAEKGVLLDVLRDWMGWGNELPDGKTVVSLLNTLTDDVPIIEYLYATCRSSNPLLSSLGTITRNAQDKRNIKMQEYNIRISREQDKLRKAGIEDTKWMYDEEGRIINPYDWEKFNKEYKKVIKDIKKTGLKGIDFKIALQEVVNNELTQEVVVDTTTGRTERFPVFYKTHSPLDDLSDVQLEYYEEIMQIKGELGTMLPDYARSHYLPPQVRSNSLFDSKGWKDFFKRIGSNIADLFRITESDVDFAGSIIYADTIDGDAIIEAEANYDDSPVKEIPVYYTKKLKDSSKLITDFSGALQHLASVAINYSCMSEIEDVALLISDFLHEQGIAARKGMGTVKAEILKSSKNKLAKQIGNYFSTSNTAHIAEGFIDREFYGEKIKGNPKLAKIVQTLLGYTRFKQLATNVPGAVSNLLVGEYQIFLESMGIDNFNFVNYVWACTKLFGDNTIKAPGRIMDFLVNNTTELNTLIGNFFDPQQEAFASLGHKRYNGAMRNLFSLDASGALYGIGEYLIHYTVMYAMLHHEKVMLNGKKVSLYDAFEKSETLDGNNELKLKEGVHLIEKDSFGNDVEGRELTSLDDDYLLDFRRKIRSVNQECAGAMNIEDRGVLSQRLVGRAVMQFRQWMVEHFSRRYRGLHYDGSMKQWTEGWWVTTAKFLGMNSRHLYEWSWKSRLKAAELKTIIEEYEKEINHRTISDNAFKSLKQQALLAKKQLKNLRMVSAELLATILISVGSTLWWELGGEDEDNALARFGMYEAKRLAREATTGTPIGIPLEVQALIEKPAASVSNMSGFTYVLCFGIINGDIAEKYDRGTHKGQNKYLVKSARKVLPLYKDIENWQKMYDDNHKYWHDMILPFDLSRGSTR